MGINTGTKPAFHHHQLNMPSQNKCPASTDFSPSGSPAPPSLDLSASEDMPQAKRFKNYEDRYDVDNKTNEEVLVMLIFHIQFYL